MRAFPPGFKVNIVALNFFSIYNYLKALYHAILLWIFLKMLKLYLLNSENFKDFGAVLLFETIYFDRPLVCSAKDSVKDGHAGSWHRLKLEKVGPTFSRFNLPAQNSPKTLLWFSAPWWSLFDIFFTVLQEYFLYGKPGGYSTNVYAGRLRPEVQPHTLLNVIFHEKGTPFVQNNLSSLSAVHQTLVTYSFVGNSQTSTTHPSPLPAHSVAAPETLTMGKHHTLSTTQEEQDKMNITLLVTQQT